MAIAACAAITRNKFAFRDVNKVFGSQETLARCGAHKECALLSTYSSVSKSRKVWYNTLSSYGMPTSYK